MPGLPEYRTRILLKDGHVPLVDGVFISSDSELSMEELEFPVFVKAQIPGATSRKKQGLVRKVENVTDLTAGITELSEFDTGGRLEGILITQGVDLKNEYYAACILDFGSEHSLPGGVILFSPEGGSGVEERSDTLIRIPFSLLGSPSKEEILTHITNIDNADNIASFLSKLAAVFIESKLLVLEINPVGGLSDGSLLAIDCRAEFEKSAVTKANKDFFFPPGKSSAGEMTGLEKTVELINRDDPSGTGFFRLNTEPIPEGALRVATNLCGGGGKMLWEMTTGARTDIYTMNESDTSGGLSAFKSYRILRVILAQENAQVLLLTGSGMAFQNQYYIAAAVWKALRETASPLPCLLRFGGTAEDRAQELFEMIKDYLPVPVRVYPPEIFPNAMVDDISEIAMEATPKLEPAEVPPGTPAIRVEVPPADIYFYPERWNSKETPPSVEACPSKFLKWTDGKLETDPDSKCIGCLMCETASILYGKSELLIHLEMPEGVE